jgi:hypothetical protein
MKLLLTCIIVAVLWVSGCTTMPPRQACERIAPNGVKYACFVDDPHYDHDRYRKNSGLES